MLQHTQVIKFGALAAICANAWSVVLLPDARAAHGISAPCAVVDSYNGESQILDRTRSQVADVDKGAPITCGGWISVTTGWVKLKHRNGYRIQIAPATFVNFPERDEHLVLYKGEVFADAGGGTGEMKILTANSRARVSRGKIIVSFNHVEDESQLITLENTATLENRFAESERMLVKAGEASSLNVGLNRVVPSIPAAVAVAQLRPKMMALHLSESEQSEAVAATTARRERKFASLPSGERAPAGETTAQRRARKIIGARSKDLTQYNRHHHQPVDRKLRAHLTRKLAGGESVGNEILYPDRYYGRTQKVQILVEDPGASLDAQRRKTTDVEKQRLIRELSQIRIDQ